MHLNEKIDMTGRLYLALEQIENCEEFSALIPEVRTNFVYASKESTDPEDVLAVDGRITVVDKLPKAAGKIKFGVSGYMANLILEIRKHDPEIRSAIDFANSPQITSFLKDYCKEKGWIFSGIDRRSEPESIKDPDEVSASWEVAEAIQAAGGQVPRVFSETGAVGKEPVSIFVGKDPLEIAYYICELAKRLNKP
ncbi:Phosphomethylpyrimidine kinase [Methanosarcina horonobensis HB-1 = JCM 15518]|uniref:Phosphomethylpyrimidine kinase n=1 Tax=Methanosarcina horonobensis HB-1 = JCM 15518 TaxID=1434110 RepID=A0A0E3WVU5_9EURY|nr:thiamine-phosphate synthase family protein [Methanosarcina horonobensis]AKB78500.1 Phosphomethylpyrimidine kinase [Methanosarcina horonobensis HB-1 = JCM 15518]